MIRAIADDFDKLSELLKGSFFSDNPLVENDVVSVNGVLYYLRNGEYINKEEADKKEIEAETASEGEKK